MKKASDGSTPALILAAGEGTRLRGRAKHKTIIRIAGIPLLGRILLGLKEVEIKDVYVVIGHEGEAVRECIGESYAGLNVNYIVANDWKKGNLYSFLAAKGSFDRNFILCMGDHLFDPEIVRRLFSFDINGILTLSVDRVEHSLDDVKVLERNGAIIDIGRSINDWNCVDIGIFLCSPKVFTYADEAVKLGATELMDCVRLIAKDGGAKVLDVSGCYWVDVDTEEDLRLARRVLVERSQKGRGASDFVSHYFNRPLENAIVYRICDSRITPNQLTIATNALAYLVTALFLTGNLLIGSILTFAVGVMDGLDGKLARVRLRPTKLGLLEHPFDLLFEFSWLIALSSFLSRMEGLLPLLLAAVAIAIMAFYRSCYDYFSRATGVSLDVYGKFERSFRRIAGRRNVYNVYILAGALLGGPLYSLIGILIHAIFTAVIYAWRAAIHLHALDKLTLRT